MLSKVVLYGVSGLQYCCQMPIGRLTRIVSNRELRITSYNNPGYTYSVYNVLFHCGGCLLLADLVAQSLPKQIGFTHYGNLTRPNAPLFCLNAISVESEGFRCTCRLRTTVWTQLRLARRCIVRLLWDREDETRESDDLRPWEHWNIGTRD